MTKIRIPADFGPRGALEWIELWSRVGDAPELTLEQPEAPAGAELSESPPLLSLLAASFRARRAEGRTTTLEGRGIAITAPLAFVAVKAPLGPWSYSAADTSGGFLFQRMLKDLRSARSMADSAAELLQTQLPTLSPSIARMVRFVMEELAANVVQHTGRPDTGVGLVQADVKSARLYLSFADCGVGFRESLARNPELAGRVSDEAEALQLALAPRITGTDRPRTNMGVGLKLLVDLADLLSGDLYLASGDALLVRRSVAGQRANVVRQIAKWPGSWICLDSPLP